MVDDDSVVIVMDDDDVHVAAAVDVVWVVVVAVSSWDAYRPQHQTYASSWLSWWWPFVGVLMMSSSSVDESDHPSETQFVVDQIVTVASLLFLLLLPSFVVDIVAVTWYFYWMFLLRAV